MTEFKVNIDNLSEDEKDLLLSLVEKANKPEKKAWKPKFGEDYYFIGYYGVSLCKFKNTTGECELYNLGNCFRTEEEAKFMLERLKVITEMKRFAEENNEEIDWNNPTMYKHCCIVYYYSSNELGIYSGCYYKSTTIYFSSKEIAEKCIEKVGADRIKKYYLQV